MRRDTAERMRSVRVRTRVPVVLRGGKREERCEAVEIAPGGVFVATETLRPLYQLLSLRLEPPDGQPLDVLGMVSRRVEPSEGLLERTPVGIGIRFYGLRPETQKAWQEFVRRRAAEALKERAEALAATSGLDPRFVSAALKADSEAGLEMPEPDESEVSGVRAEPGSSSRPRPPSSIEADMLAEALALSEVAGDSSSPAPATEGGPGRPSLGVAPIYVVDGDRASIESAPPPRKTSPPADPGPSSREEVQKRREEADTERLTLTGIAPAKAAAPAAGADDGQAEEEPADTVEDLSEVAAAIRFATSAREGGPAFEAAEPGDEEDDEDRPTALPPEPAPATALAPTSPVTAPKGLGAPLSNWGLAPAEPLAHVVYRLELPTVEALEGFADSALEAGGVFVRTPDVRPPGTPAVVCVVHPESRDEFHLPGTVVEGPSPAAGVAVAFTAVTPRTLLMFRNYIALGVPVTPVPREESREHELAMVRHGSDVGPEGDEDDDVPRDTAEIDMSDVLPILNEE